MKKLTSAVIFSLVLLMAGCNTVKGTAAGFNKDMDSLTGKNKNSQSTSQSTHYSTSNSSNNY